jgi:hypothetical protein
MPPLRSRVIALKLETWDNAGVPGNGSCRTPRKHSNSNRAGIFSTVTPLLDGHCG